MDVVDKVKALRLAAKMVSDPLLVKQLNEILARKTEFKIDMDLSNDIFRIEVMTQGDIAYKCKEFLDNVKKTLEG